MAGHFLEHVEANKMFFFQSQIVIVALTGRGGSSMADSFQKEL